MIKRILYLLNCICLLSGCATSVSPEDLNILDDKDFAYATIPDYLIGVEDTVQINVWRNTDLSVSVPVRPDGMISVPLIGDVTAG